MLRTETASIWRDRIIGLFKKEPETAFPLLQIEKRLDGIKAATLNYHLSRLLKEEFLVKPRHGLYQLNPNQLKTMTVEEAQAKLETHLETSQRVQSNGIGWDAKVAPITKVEGPALAARRLHFASIVDRMKQNPAFAASDVELLLSAVSPELRPT